MEKRSRWFLIKEAVVILLLWLAIMSSFFSVAYVLISYFIILNTPFTETEEHRYLILLFGYLSLLVAMVILWLRGRHKKVESNKAIVALKNEWLTFKESQKPKIRVSYSKKIPGCFQPDVDVVAPSISDYQAWVTVKGTCYRVLVGFDGDRTGTISNCHGIIKLIEKDSITKMAGENLILPFAPAEAIDATSKTLYDKVPAHLNVLYTTENNQVIIPCTYIPRSINFEELFLELGQYKLTVVIVGTDTASFEFRLKFNWTGNWRTAELIL